MRSGSRPFAVGPVGRRGEGAGQTLDRLGECRSSALVGESEALGDRPRWEERGQASATLTSPTRADLHPGGGGCGAHRRPVLGWVDHVREGHCSLSLSRKLATSRQAAQFAQSCPLSLLVIAALQAAGDDMRGQARGPALGGLVAQEAEVAFAGSPRPASPRDLAASARQPQNTSAWQASAPALASTNAQAVPSVRKVTASTKQNSA